MNFRTRILQRMAYKQLTARPAVMEPLDKMKTTKITYPPHVSAARGKEIEVGDIVSCYVYPDGTREGKIVDIPNEITVRVRLFRKNMQPFDLANDVKYRRDLVVPCFIDDIKEYFPKALPDMYDEELEIEEQECEDCGKI